MTIREETTKNGTTLWIRESFRKEDGTVSSRNIERLGTLEEIMAMDDCDGDPHEWARRRLEEYRMAAKEGRRLVKLALDPNKLIARNEQRSFNGGYLFLQQQYCLFGLDRIFKAIDSNKFGDRKTIREDYQSLRRKLGRIPKLIEFYSYGAVDPVKIIDYYGSYPKFLEAVHDPGAPSFDDAEMKVLKFISKLISPGMRRREIDTLEALLQGTDDFEATVSKLYPNIDPRARNNLMNIFEGTFFSIDKTALVVGNSVEPGFAKSLETPSFREHIEQVIEIGRKNNEEHYSNPVEGTDLVLCSQYSYEDVCRFLRFDKALSPNNIGGYYYDRKTRTFPIFVNYVKGKDVKESQKYEDQFENRSTFIALSKSTEGKDSKRMKIVENSDAEGVAIHLFVRKKKLGVVNKDSDFYYLGRIHFVEFLDDNKPVKIRYRLEEEVRQDIYDYLTMPDDEEN